MKFLKISLITGGLITSLFSFGFGHHHITCQCIPGVSCANVIPQMAIAQKTINISYKFMDKLMAAQMYNVKLTEKQVLQKQKEIQKLTYQIRKLQEAIAFEDNKKVFLLKKINKLNLYKGIK